MLHKEREGKYKLLKILSIPEDLRIKLKFFKYPLELGVFEYLKRVYSVE
jgi:hypothetical protein